jgi:hypothetical protein
MNREPAGIFVRLWEYAGLAGSTGGQASEPKLLGLDAR